MRPRGNDGQTLLVAMNKNDKTIKVINLGEKSFDACTTNGAFAVAQFAIDCSFYTNEDKAIIKAKEKEYEICYHKSNTLSTVVNVQMDENRISQVKHTLILL